MSAPFDHGITGNDRTILFDVPTQLGPYRLKKLLGKGGMGEVWLAVDTHLDREVAMKLMRRELLTNEEAVKRFHREARSVARLNHPNIVQVYSFGEEKGIIYFVMEFVDGESIAERLRACGTMDVDEAVFYLLQAIEGLGYASARGLVHRDIKPSNLMLTPDKRIKIADFGLAKMIEHDSHVTASGTSMGSPCYMSPEQARGQEADHRSDIYSLGITFYQMLTGELPFTAPAPVSILLKHLQDPLPEPEELKGIRNGQVLEVIKKMTAKSSDDRFQTYGGLAAAIGDLAPDAQLRSSAFMSTASIQTPGSPGAPQAENPPQQVAVKAAEEQPRAARRSVLKFVVPLLALAAAGAIGAAVYFYSEGSAVKSTQPQVANPDQTIGTAAPVVTPVHTATPAIALNTPTPTPGTPPIARQTTVPDTAVQAPASTQKLFDSLEKAPVTGRARLGRPGQEPGTKVQVFQPNGEYAGTIEEGTMVDFLQESGSFCAIRHMGKNLLVQKSDIQSVPLGQTPPLSTPQGGKFVVLGTTGGAPDEMIMMQSAETGGRALPAMKAGTELRVIEERQTGYQVLLPNGSQAFVYKGTARLKQ